MKLSKIAKQTIRRQEQNVHFEPYLPLQEFLSVGLLAIHSYIVEAENTLDALWHLKKISEEDPEFSKSSQLLRDFGRDAVGSLRRLSSTVVTRTFKGVTKLKRTVSTQKGSQKGSNTHYFQYEAILAMWSELSTVDSLWRGSRLDFQWAMENHVSMAYLGSKREQIENHYRELCRSSDKISLQLVILKRIWTEITLEMYPQGPKNKINLKFVKLEEWDCAKDQVLLNASAFYANLVVTICDSLFQLKNLVESVASLFYLIDLLRDFARDTVAQLCRICFGHLAPTLEGLVNMKEKQDKDLPLHKLIKRSHFRDFHLGWGLLEERAVWFPSNALPFYSHLEESLGQLGSKEESVKEG
ncbi:hypothetical protein T439DRAFT_336414 [Meredithblackwellia eburnea MCA 4105]